MISCFTSKRIMTGESGPSLKVALIMVYMGRCIVRHLLGMPIVWPTVYTVTHENSVQL